MPTVSINGESNQYQVKKDETLYDALKSQGKELPHGCLAGSCGACRVEITGGQDHLSPPSIVEQDTIDSIKVNYNRLYGDEFLNGKTIRLSCRAKVLGDVEIKLLDLPTLKKD